MNQKLIDELNAIDDPQKLISEIFTRFKDKAAIGTSGQLSGVVLIDMAVKSKLKPRVFTVDTLRLFPETYAFLDELEKKYQLKFERYGPDKNMLDRMIKQHGLYLFFDTKEKQEYCCRVRKVLPNEQALKTVDVWITGLRKDQSKNRQETEKVKLIHHDQDKHPILKVAPLANWDEKMVLDYCKKNNVPIHPLLNQNPDDWHYESVGCILCTTPISPSEPKRAGRWRWFNQTDPDKKECGIHLPVNEEE